MGQWHVWMCCSVLPFLVCGFYIESKRSSFFDTYCELQMYFRLTSNKLSTLIPIELQNHRLHMLFIYFFFLNAWTKCHGNSYNRCCDISVWKKVSIWVTDWLTINHFARMAKMADSHCRSLQDPNSGLQHKSQTCPDFLLRYIKGIMLHSPIALWDTALRLKICSPVLISSHFTNVFVETNTYWWLWYSKSISSCCGTTLTAVIEEGPGFTKIARFQVEILNHCSEQNLSLAV